MNSIPLLITAAAAGFSGIVIGFTIAGLFVRRQLHAAAHQAYMEAVHYYQEEAAKERR